MAHKSETIYICMYDYDNVSIKYKSELHASEIFYIFETGAL